MYVGYDSQPSDTGENESYTFDFANDVAVGETVSLATWSIVVVRGVDTMAPSRLVGAPVNAGTKTSQRIALLQDGATYRILASVLTSAGNTLSLWTHVTCSAPE